MIRNDGTHGVVYHWTGQCVHFCKKNIFTHRQRIIFPLGIKIFYSLPPVPNILSKSDHPIRANFIFIRTICHSIYWHTICFKQFSNLIEPLRMKAVFNGSSMVFVYHYDVIFQRVIKQKREVNCDRKSGK